MAISTSLKTAPLTSVPLSAQYTPSRPIQIPARGKLVRPPIPSPLKCPPSPDLIFPMSPESLPRESPLATYQPFTPNTLHNPHDEPPTQWYPVHSDSRSSNEPFMYHFPTLPQNNAAVGRDKDLSPTSISPPFNGSRNIYGCTRSHKYPATTFHHATPSSLSSRTKSQRTAFVNKDLELMSNSSVRSYIHPLMSCRAGYVSPPAISIISSNYRGTDSSVDTESSVYTFDRFLSGTVEDEKCCLAG